MQFLFGQFLSWFLTINQCKNIVAEKKSIIKNMLYEMVKKLSFYYNLITFIDHCFIFS